MKHYIGLWLLLATALAVVVIVSAYSPINIGGFELRDSGIVSAMTDTSSLSDQSDKPDVFDLPNLPDSSDVPEVVPPDTTAKVLLLLGDSMLEGLSPRLAAYAEANGHTLYTVIWYSSTTEIWGKSGMVAHYVEKFHPDFVFISLGANELFVRDIAKKRTQYVQKMVEELGNTSYLWIGPPNWKEDTGVNEMVAANTGEGCFFLSRDMHFERAKDGAHPTRESAVLWMDSIVRWMPDHIARPFRLDLPTKHTSRPKEVIVHQPAK